MVGYLRLELEQNLLRLTQQITRPKVFMGKRRMIYPFCIGITPFERIKGSQREQLNSGYIKIDSRGDLRSSDFGDLDPHVNVHFFCKEDDEHKSEEAAKKCQLKLLSEIMKEKSNEVVALLIDGDLKVLDFVCEMVKEYNKDNKNLLLAVMATDTKNPSAASELKKAWEEKKKRYEEEEKKRKDEEETKKKKNEDAQGEPSKPQSEQGDETRGSISKEISENEENNENNNNEEVTGATETTEATEQTNIKTILESIEPVIIESFSFRDIITSILGEAQNPNPKQSFTFAVQRDLKDYAIALLKNSKDDEANDFFKIAFEYNNETFVDYVLNYGAKDLLNEHQLKELYLEAEHLKKLLPKKFEEHGLEEIRNFLSDSTDFEKITLQQKDTDSRAEKHKMNTNFEEDKENVAEYFWKETERPFLNALIAAWVADILKKQSEKKFDQELIKAYKEIKSKFEERAVAILETAYKSDSSAGRTLLNYYGEPHWPNLRLIDIAARAELEV
ncbi:unnamed protein product [Enterobius vermicularis]|uniref:ANK_REP_REGION domain-containing protein n=1 Tax=Enterobius vermicularis TaxID=51028 RepID=A0A0N4UY99_ENTVE|nr:unnamed protein product [Enterobius vermicularis]